jgi:DNA modification methylase
VNPYYQDDAVTLYHGDCLEVLTRLQLPQLAAIITDPPYASGTRHESDKSGRGSMLRGQRFSDKPIDLDRMTTTGFVWLMRSLILATYDSLEDGGSVLSFIDWRQWPTLVAALETCNLRVQTMVVWDKQAIGMGNGFRQQHELVCHASKGVPKVHNRSTPNVLQAPRQEPDDHPSPKPEGLLRRLVEVVTEPGDIVLDPFVGTGRPIRAFKDAGRRVIGMERDERYCEIAAKRLSQEVLDFGGAA